LNETAWVAGKLRIVARDLTSVPEAREILPEIFTLPCIEANPIKLAPAGSGYSETGEMICKCSPFRMFEARVAPLPTDILRAMDTDYLSSSGVCN